MLGRLLISCFKKLQNETIKQKYIYNTHVYANVIINKVKENI